MNINMVLDKLVKMSASQRMELVNGLKQTAAAEKMMVGDRYISFLPVPLFVEKSISGLLNKRLDLFIELLLRLERYALSSEGSEVFERLYNSLCEGGRHLVSQCLFESEFSMKRRHRRVDGFFDYKTGNGGIIEVNQAAPLATHFYDTSQRLSAQFLNYLGFDYEPCLTAPRILQWFIDEYRERFADKTGLPDVIALVIEHGYLPKFTDLPGVAGDCEKLALELYGHKMKIVTCFPYEISLSGDNIMFNKEKVDLVWRNSVYMTAYRQQGLPIEDYETILSRSDDFLILNSTRTWLTRTKELFALFADDVLYDKLGFDNEQKAVLRVMIPLTVNTGKNGEMHGAISSEKDQWISKPTDSGFGTGVVFGSSMDRDSWNKLIDERSCDGFVFQKKIFSPEIDVMTISAEGLLEEVRLDYDFCPHHINGSFSASALVRANLKREASDFATMNLATGGYLMPLVFV